MRPFLALTGLFAAAAVTTYATQLPFSASPAPPAVPKAADGFIDAILGTKPNSGSISGGGGLGSDQAGGLTLADRLSLERRATLWWEYARDIAQVTARLSHPGSTTLLVPLDKAILSMPRKPHQNPSGPPANDDEARANVEAFLSAHIVPSSMGIPTGKPYQTLLSSLSVSIIPDDSTPGGYKVTPGDIAVIDIKDASNGQIVYIDGVIPY